MYEIFLTPDGKYHCYGRLQDGTENWIEPDLKAAIKSMKKFAKVMNGAKIKKKHITFLRPVQVARVEYERYNPFE